MHRLNLIYVVVMLAQVSVALGDVGVRVPHPPGDLVERRPGLGVEACERVAQVTDAAAAQDPAEENVSLLAHPALRVTAYDGPLPRQGLEYPRSVALMGTARSR